MIIISQLANGSYLHQLDTQIWTWEAGLKMIAESTLEGSWWGLKAGLTKDSMVAGLIWNLEVDLIMYLK